MTPPPVHPDVKALETLLGRKKELCSLAISLDGYHRWGNGGDPKFEAFATSELAESRAIEVRLQKLVARIQERSPEVIGIWARAHMTLLEDYLSRVDSDSTAAFVAKRELAEWRQVVAGKRAYVEENPAHVKPDAALYARLFDCPLPKSYW